ncbi:MAG: hypothetical protein A2W22_05490 [Candidatus Levybacteria bacterium RBG_16_35_11]|nr:MAG: hypothetical protein A2W22_05490 [Candidatus Levybacteria bacterium RBG_16_35_11]
MADKKAELELEHELAMQRIQKAHELKVKELATEHDYRMQEIRLRSANENNLELQKFRMKKEIFHKK